MEWLTFLKEKFRNVITKCSNSSNPGPDCISWRHLKIVVDDDKCLFNIVNITNTHINLSYWPLHFKMFTSIIIPKPNKALYNSPKIFCLIVLLNTLKKLIEKVIEEILQYQSIIFNFVHPNQLNSLKQWLTTDTSIVLTHLIWSGWVKDLQTSTLAFEIAQFLPLLNHQILPLIMVKTSFSFRISLFFSNYLIDRKTQYMWNNFVFPFFNANIGISQESALSPILSALYIASIFHIFEKRSKSLFHNSSISFLSFVDEGFFILQEKSFKKSNTFPFCNYNIISSLFDQFGLPVEHRKLKVFYFSRSTKNFNPSSLDLSSLEESIL